jgi:hypothetical protein
MKNAENIDLMKGLNRKLYKKVKDAYNTAIERNPKLGKGLKESDTDSNSDSDSDSDNEGGALWDSVKSFVKPIVKRETDKIHAITHPVETYSKTSDFGSKLIHGRKDYPPSAKAIIDKYANNTVEHVELHRKPLPSLYTNIMNVWTKGETNKRLAEQPKDTLFHISMWVRVSGGTTILVEKNEVIHLQVNPKLAKEEEIQVAPSPPAGLKFKDMFDKTLAKVGPENMFSYSARDNNCGNFIEYILNANGMSSQATNDFIGQDTKTIMKGFPILNKTLNNLTDTAGRANVLIEGGGVMDDLMRLMRRIRGQDARVGTRPPQTRDQITQATAQTPAPPSRGVPTYYTPEELVSIQKLIPNPNLLGQKGKEADCAPVPGLEDSERGRDINQYIEDRHRSFENIVEKIEQSRQKRREDAMNKANDRLALSKELDNSSYSDSSIDNSGGRVFLRRK